MTAPRAVVIQSYSPPSAVDEAIDSTVRLFMSKCHGSLTRHIDFATFNARGVIYWQKQGDGYCSQCVYIVLRLYLRVFYIVGDLLT